MKKYIITALICILCFIAGMITGFAIVYKNLYDAIPWEEELQNNTLEREIIVQDMERLHKRLDAVNESFEQFWLQVESMFPALEEQ